MSATGRSEAAGTIDRDPDDFYATPSWCVDVILPHLGDLTGKSILEPGCGTGAIIRALPRAGFVTGIEMHAGRAATASALGRGVVHCADYFAWARSVPTGEFDIAIGNPPFSLAMEFAKETLRIARRVAFLLRLPWLASQGRADWMRANTPSVYVLPSRPEFVASLSCKSKCGWKTSLPIEAPRPKACPSCGGKVQVTTTDATDYMWAVWGEESPRVVILDAKAA